MLSGCFEFPSRPPSGSVQAPASGAANGRLVVAARALDRETVNYSSKQRSHSVPRVTELPKTTTASLRYSQSIGQDVYPKPLWVFHRSTVRRGRFQLCLPVQSVGRSPSLALSVEECAGFFPSRMVEKTVPYNRENSAQRPYGP